MNSPSFPNWSVNAFCDQKKKKNIVSMYVLIFSRILSVLCWPATELEYLPLRTSVPEGSYLILVPLEKIYFNLLLFRSSQWKSNLLASVLHQDWECGYFNVGRKMGKEGSKIAWKHLLHERWFPLQRGTDQGRWPWS